MAKFQYFGPPFSIQLSDRTLQLRSGSVVQLDESGVDTVRSYDGVRLVPISEPKTAISRLLGPEPISGITEESTVFPEVLDKPNGGFEQGESDKKKKKKRKKEQKKNAPSTDHEG